MDPLYIFEGFLVKIFPSMTYKYVYSIQKIIKTMPISIPISVEGVSVPGLVNGPLSALYSNKYSLAVYNFPKDVGTNSAKSHVIKFTALVPKPQNNNQGIATNIVETGKGFVNDLRKAAEEAKKGNTLSEKFSAGVSGLSLSDGTKTNLKSLLDKLTALDVLREPATSIALYVPDTVNVTYGAAYDDISLTESLGKAYFIAQAAASLGDYYDAAKQGESMMNLANKAGNDPFLRNYLAGVLGQKIGAQNLPELALKQVGQAINPQLQVLFRGVGFRTFQFDFILSPKSKDESVIIQNIIKSFKFHAAPEIVPNQAFSQSVFLKVPDLFKIEFFHKGLPNNSVHKIGTCVLENINVDYAPNGWSAFNDGSPVQTRLSLQFKEIEIIDKNKINEGY